MPTQIRRLTTIYGTTTYGLRVLEWNGKGQLGKYVSKPGISSGLNDKSVHVHKNTNFGGSDKIYRTLQTGLKMHSLGKYAQQSFFSII